MIITVVALTALRESPPISYSLSDLCIFAINMLVCCDSIGLEISGINYLTRRLQKM